MVCVPRTLLWPTGHLQAQRTVPVHAGDFLPQSETTSDPRSVLCPPAGWTESLGEVMPFRSTPQITRNQSGWNPSIWLLHPPRPQWGDSQVHSALPSVRPLQRCLSADQSSQQELTGIALSGSLPFPMSLPRSLSYRSVWGLPEPGMCPPTPIWGQPAL